jgi:hypothetical protein
MCSSSGIHCVNQNLTINRNGIIILEFYSLSQGFITDLNNKYPVYLESLTDKIKLNIVETLKGDKNVTQVLFKPESELKLNEKYNLIIDSLPWQAGKLKRYNVESSKWELLTFTGSDYEDNESPTFTNNPKELNKKLVYYGCGPSTFVSFKIFGKDGSELFVRATLKNKKNGRTTTYILKLVGDVVKVGHGMCSGGFRFDDGEKFEVSFQLFDQSGNRSATTKVITFTKPTKPTYDE